MKQRNVQLRNSPPNVESQGTKPSRWAPTSTKAPNLSMARTIPVLGWLQNATDCRYCYYCDDYYYVYYDYYHCYYNYNYNNNNNNYYYYHHYSMLAFSSAATLYPLICPCQSRGSVAVLFVARKQVPRADGGALKSTH